MRQSAALSSATGQAMSTELGGKWGIQCLNTIFPLLILPRAGYSVNLCLVVFLIFFHDKLVSILETNVIQVEA